MQHHAYVVAGESSATLSRAVSFLERTYGLSPSANPDLIVRQYGLLSVEDARALGAIAMLTPVTGETKALVLVAERIYHEAQNALLKLLEEPPPGTVIVLSVPHVAMLLPTVRSRVVPLPGEGANAVEPEVSQDVQMFLAASQEERTVLIKKLTTGKDEGARRALRDKAIQIMDGVERRAYALYRAESDAVKREALHGALCDMETLRGYLYDRAAPVRMILEHVSLVLPRL